MWAACGASYSRTDRNCARCAVRVIGLTLEAGGVRRGPPSLVGRLLLAQVAPLAILAAALALAGALAARQVVEKSSDRLLAGSVTAIVAQIGARDGRATVNLSPWSLGLLDNPERDAVFYDVRQGRRLITGYDDLPRLPAPPPNETNFAYGRMRGMPVRIAQSTVMVPGVQDPVVVAVAQSLDSRQASVRELLFSLIGLPVLMVLVAAVLVWPAVTWGLAPLRRLTADLTGRSLASRPDFTPAQPIDAPAELSPVVAAFNRLMSSLERSTLALERFSADASHQLRTPLSVIVANLALLDRSVTAPVARDLLTDSRDAASNLQRVLSQLLALARSEATASEGVADLQGLIEAIAAEAARAFPEAHVRRRLPAGPMALDGNAILIGELLRNLIFNACGYGGGEVLVAARLSGSRLRLTIWDHGPGVAEQDLETVFTPFKRGAVGDVEPGAGLGLAIVRSIAEKLKIDVGLRNRRRRSGLVIELDFARAPASL
jgi:two-component system sensor histidine kinase TctE